MAALAADPLTRYQRCQQWAARHQKTLTIASLAAGMGVSVLQEQAPSTQGVTETTLVLSLLSCVLGLVLLQATWRTEAPLLPQQTLKAIAELSLIVSPVLQLVHYSFDLSAGERKVVTVLTVAVAVLGMAAQLQSAIDPFRPQPFDDRPRVQQKWAESHAAQEEFRPRVRGISCRHGWMLNTIQILYHQTWDAPVHGRHHNDGGIQARPLWLDVDAGEEIVEVRVFSDCVAHPGKVSGVTFRTSAGNEEHFGQRPDANGHYPHSDYSPTESEVFTFNPPKRFWAISGVAGNIIESLDFHDRDEEPALGRFSAENNDSQAGEADSLLRRVTSVLLRRQRQRANSASFASVELQPAPVVVRR